MWWSATYQYIVIHPRHVMHGENSRGVPSDNKIYTLLPLIPTHLTFCKMFIFTNSVHWLTHEQLDFCWVKHRCLHYMRDVAVMIGNTGEGVVILLPNKCCIQCLYHIDRALWTCYSSHNSSNFSRLSCDATSILPYICALRYYKLTWTDVSHILCGTMNL